MVAIRWCVQSYIKWSFRLLCNSYLPQHCRQLYGNDIRCFVEENRPERESNIVLTGAEADLVLVTTDIRARGQPFRNIPSLYYSY
ncbi:hypothetical protein PoB_007402100 [Plakobranchus ocellatus]|uniref:Helicase C-terminal domain-containing protein n=1 Tax=Plakobranchus ocellatus TaxID=259542 RepID=A0AAV4DUE1_9GAST|nr:hypothetical protein PoB_007402100 [Plakobranchus ocellatus]